MDLKFAAIFLIFCEILSNVYGQVSLTLTRQPVKSLPLRLRCIADQDISTAVRFYKGVTIQGYCTADGQCVSRNRAFSLQRSSREVTLTIPSLSNNEEGTWSCRLYTDPLTFSNEVVIENIPAAVDWRKVTFTPEWSSRRSVSPDETIMLRVHVPCTNKAPTFIWKYQMGARGKFQNFPYYYFSTYSRETDCPSGQKQYTSTCTILGKTPKFYNRRLKVRVDVEHDSFDPPRYMKFRNSRTIQFPVPIKSVTMSSDQEQAILIEGETVSFSCMTSRSFPPARVLWFTNDDGQPVELSESVTSSSQPYPDTAVSTTSNVTMAARRDLHGKKIFCQASNMEDQPSVSSNEVELTVFYPPYKPDITIPNMCAGSETTVTCDSMDTGNPASNYSWIRNGEAIMDGLSDNGSMWTFTPSAADNGTEILCYLSNNITDKEGNSRVDSDVTNLNVLVYDLPELSIEGDRDIYEGDNLTLTCISDLPEVMISWSYPGGFAEGPTLALTNVSFNDTGLYLCVGKRETICGLLSPESNPGLVIDVRGVSQSSTLNSNRILVLHGVLLAALTFIFHL